jgi:DNA-binding response OmpR family regulator
MSSSERDRPDEEAAVAVAAWLRLADETLGATAPRDLDSRQTGRKGGSHATALVVEDDHPTRESVVSALRDAGISSVGVPDGTEALAACQRRDPDLVVLDLALPGLDGARFADAYRRIPGSSARIIVISATDRGSETAARIRADAFLSKPFQLDALVALAERLLGEAA